MDDMDSMDAKTVARLIEGFRKCRSGDVADGIMDLGLLQNTRCFAEGITAIDPELPTMVGTAVTIREGPPRVGKTITKPFAHGEVMRGMEEGQILVLDAGGMNGVGLWGGLFHIEAVRKNVTGLVIDGTIRDLNEIKAMKIPVFCTGVNPMPSGKLVETMYVNQPVMCGGVHVCPGDFVIGDDSGVIFVPPEYAEAVLERALRKAEVDARKAANLWKVPIDRLTEAHDNADIEI